MDNALYGTPMPQGGAMPQGVPMGGAPAPPNTYGAPAPQMAPPAPVAAAPRPSQPMVGAVTGMAGALARPTVGQNGYGVHPEVSHAQIVDYLLPKFKNVESSGDYTNYIGKKAKLPWDSKKSASGAYGYIDSTWNHHEGYPRAMDAPPEVQDARMHQDLLHSINRFQGDPFKVAANHYYPAWASDPTKWEEPLKDHYGKEIPGAGSIRQYLEKVLPADRVDKYLAAVKGNGGSSAGGM